MRPGMRARRLLVQWVGCVVVVWMLAACQTLATLPAPGADASTWVDVSLPSVVVADAYTLTVLTTDGGASSIEPGATCPAVAALDGGHEAEAGSPPTDAALDANACTTPAAPGDLVFDEVMISSVAGSSDRGQWLEVRSTRACALDLSGLTASAPHGQSFHTLTVATDVWLPAFGFFLIADSVDPSENNDLPGLVLAWDGSPADALHKTSDTVTLAMGTVTLDTLSYPSKKRVAGTSLAFPAGCSPSLRRDFSSWLPSVASWSPGFFGTPGAPNTDVHCPVAPVPTCHPKPG